MAFTIPILMFTTNYVQNYQYSQACSDVNFIYLNVARLHVAELSITLARDLRFTRSHLIGLSIALSYRPAVLMMTRATRSDSQFRHAQWELVVRRILIPIWANIHVSTSLWKSLFPWISNVSIWGLVSLLRAIYILTVFSLKYSFHQSE